MRYQLQTSEELCWYTGDDQTTAKYCGEFQKFYIPLVDTLQMSSLRCYHKSRLVYRPNACSKHDIAHCVLQPFVHNEGRLTSFTNGDAFYFYCMTPHMKDGHILLIHLYNDEFEVVNPNGAARGKHKLKAT